jgi:hypothetical protein
MRITTAKLQSQVDLLNQLTNSPMTPYSKSEKGYNANIGNYHLGFAYGGVILYRMDTTGGGVKDIFSCGYMTKKEIHLMIKSYIYGLQEKTDSGLL